MNEKQKEIIELLKAEPYIYPEEKIRKIIDFLKSYLIFTNTNGYILGISGGQDSTLAGKLCQIAVNELNQEHETDKYQFVTVRLPYGVQFDESDCQDAIEFIQPSKVITVNIKPIVDKNVEIIEQSLRESNVADNISDFNKGNIKARERMITQYAIAGQLGLLVVGTDHSAENITGFFTKFGDGAADVMPLLGLNKRQGKLLLKELGCPEHLYLKIPTGDLEDDKPNLPDEVALGISYNDIDDYLEGKNINQEVANKIEKQFNKTMHKRKPPVSTHDDWWMYI